MFFSCRCAGATQILPCGSLRIASPPEADGVQTVERFHHCPGLSGGSFDVSSQGTGGPKTVVQSTSSECQKQLEKESLVRLSMLVQRRAGRFPKKISRPSNSLTHSLSGI
jgi:hypothetical protein